MKAVKHIEPGRHLPDRNERHALALDMLGMVAYPGDTLLDVGCGVGEFIEATPGVQISGRSSSRLRCPVGLDPSLGQLRVTRAVAPFPRVVAGVAESLPFSTGSFDLITALCVLEHAESPLRMLRELRRVSRGWVLLSTPNLGRPNRLWAALREREHRELTGHFQGWDYHLLRQLLTVVGLEPVDYRCRFVDCPGYALWPRLGKALSFALLRHLFPRVGSEMFFLCRVTPEE